MLKTISTNGRIYAPQRFFDPQGRICYDRIIRLYARPRKRVVSVVSATPMLIPVYIVRDGVSPYPDNLPDFRFIQEVEKLLLAREPRIILQTVPEAHQTMIFRAYNANRVHTAIEPFLRAIG